MAYVDISLFTKDGSIGHITGDMRVPLPLRAGSAVALGEPENSGIKTALNNVRIEKLLNHNGRPLLLLSDVYVGTKEDAFELLHFLEECCGLFANVHDEDDFRHFMQHSRQRDHLP